MNSDIITKARSGGYFEHCLQIYQFTIKVDRSIVYVIRKLFQVIINTSIC